MYTFIKTLLPLAIRLILFWVTADVIAIQLLNRKHEHYIDVHVLEQDKKPHFKLLIFLAGIKILSKTAN